MTEFVISLVLWLFVINLGIAFGAGLYEARITVPQWLHFSEETGYRWDAAAAREANVGLRFWAYVTTGPLTLLTLASFPAALWAPAQTRAWWMGAALAALVDRGMTFTYFIPTMLRLMRDGAMPRAKATATALRWVRLGRVRHLATLLAWLAALNALTLLAAQGAASP